jgi:hypothetical protein
MNHEVGASARDATGVGPANAPVAAAGNEGYSEKLSKAVMLAYYSRITLRFSY